MSLVNSKFITWLSLKDSIPYETSKIVAGVVVTGLVLCKCVQKYNDRREQREFQHRIHTRQVHRQRNLNELIKQISIDGVLVTPERLQVLKLSAEDILAKIEEGSLKAFEVLRAYQAKAIEATIKCNCVIEFLPEAEDWAKAVDLIPSSVDLPLKGLPVSIKEDLAIANYDSTLGYARFLGNKAKNDSVVVASLKSLGAIPFCRTNMVQTLLCSCATNPIYGHTSHPTHPGRGPGGSSGGESALIAFGGSILGVGTDIGGSVRIPAHFSGIASLKPTMGRIIATGQVDSLPGVQGMNNTPGLLGRDVDTVILAAKCLFSTGILHKHDPRSVPIPWREQLFTETRRLRVGYYDNSNVFPATPGCRRAVHVALDALKSAGHEVIQFPSPVSMSDFQRFMQLYLADGGISLLNKWKNDTIEPCLQGFHDSLKMARWFKLHIFKHYLKYKSERAAARLVGDISASKLWQLMIERRDMIDNVISKWKSLGLDVVVAPGFAYPAIADEHAGLDAHYTMLYNHLDFPAGVVPVTRESAQDQADLEAYDTMGDALLENVKKAVRGGEGLPIGVQVVALPWQEELVLRTMKEIQDSLHIPFIRNTH